MEIIGVGYTKDVQIGDTFLRENVVNMWDVIPSHQFSYIVDGIRHTLEEWTRIDESRHKVRTLRNEEMKPDLFEAINNKYSK